MKPYAATILLLVFGLSAFACGNGADDGRPTVVVSIPPQAFLVERIAGDHFRVITLLLPGESPTTYQPSDQRVSDVMRAEIYFRIGVPFERGRWLDAISGAAGPRIVDVRKGASELLQTDHDHHGDHENCGEFGSDPHIWLSPKRLIQQATTVADALSELRPDLSDAFRKNLEALQAYLRQTDDEVREILRPHRGRRFFIFHPSFAYFAEDYGLIQVPIELEGKDPSEAELTEILRQTREDGAKVIFVQPEITGRTARAVADAVGAAVRTLDPLARDVPENLLRTARAIADSFLR
jgi:zinc transport system substrate-binding protein